MSAFTNININLKTNVFKVSPPHTQLKLVVYQTKTSTWKVWVKSTVSIAPFYPCWWNPTFWSKTQTAYKVNNVMEQSIIAPYLRQLLKYHMFMKIKIVISFYFKIHAFLIANHNDFIIESSVFKIIFHWISLI